MDMIKVVRYSNFGFEPMYQNRMKEMYDFDLNFTEDMIPANITEFAKNIIINEALRQRSELDHGFSFWGIHVFIGEPREDIRRFQLNHLKGPLPARYEAYMDPRTPCRSLCEPYLLSSAEGTLQEAVKKDRYGVFIEAPFNVENMCAA